MTKHGKLAMLRIAKGFNEVAVPYTEEQKDAMATIEAAKAKERVAKILTQGQNLPHNDLDEQYRTTLDLQNQLKEKIKALKEIMARVGDIEEQQLEGTELKSKLEENRLREVYMTHKQLL